jgi:hypothetical protein
MQYHLARKTIVSVTAVAAFAWLSPPAAIAQSDAELLEAVRACQRVPDVLARLACYDRALPPAAQAADVDSVPGSREERVAAAAGPIPAPEPTPRPAARPAPVPAARPAPVPAADPAPEPTPVPAAGPAPNPAPIFQPQRDSAESLPTMVQIVELRNPSLRTTEFYAADGRVFVRSNATTIPRWPEPPFEVEIQTGMFGAIYLKFPDSGPRVRVAVRN